MATVMLSYRHETDAKHPNHQERVKELGEKLRAAGIDVVLDQFYVDAHPGGPDEQWPAWCERQVPLADKVLMIASDGYFRCYDGAERPGDGLGAACETTIIRNLLFDSHYVTEKFRVAYFDKEHLTGTPVAIRGVHRFHASDSTDVAHIIKWIQGSSSSTVVAPSTSWPAAVSEYEPDLANRGEEFNFFKDMLSGTTPERAMFLEAASNRGKTTIIKECTKYARHLLGGSPCVTVDFKGDPTKEFALDTLRTKLGGVLPNFSKPGSPPLALRNDFRALTTPTLLLFDSYEKASSEARQLVCGQLLPDLEDCSSLRVVIAGQEVPDHKSYYWGGLIRKFVMGTITDPAQWSRYYERIYGDPAGVNIRLLTKIAEGEPGVVRTFLQSAAEDRSTR